MSNVVYADRDNQTKYYIDVLMRFLPYPLHYYEGKSDRELYAMYESNKVSFMQEVLRSHGIM